MDYFGFNVVWTDIILFASALRRNIGSNKFHQANVYMLEYIIENALNEFDQKSAGEINLFLKKGINTNNEYVFLLYQSMHIEFVSDKSKKKR